MERLIVENGVFIDPLSDFGFKRVFTREVNKAVLVDLLNALLKLERPIIDITLISTEQIGDIKKARKAVFDIHGRDIDGNYFIIEVQKLKENFFKDRSVYYSTFPIRSQEKKGEWNFELKHIYTICLLDFCFDELHPEHCIHEVKLLDLNTREVFYDRLTFYYAELPKFHKHEHELITREDKWLYVLVNLQSFTEIPLSLSEDIIFCQFFMDAKKAYFTELELQAYYQSKKAEWDEFAANETAKAEGKIEAIEERNRLFVTNLLRQTGFSPEEIAKLVGVDIAFVKKIKAEIFA